MENDSYRSTSAATGTFHKILASTLADNPDGAVEIVDEGIEFSSAEVTDLVYVTCVGIKEGHLYPFMLDNDISVHDVNNLRKITDVLTGFNSVEEATIFIAKNLEAIGYALKKKCVEKELTDVTFTFNFVSHYRIAVHIT